MLPTRLAEVKQKLDAKGYNARSREEDELLSELDKIDTLLVDNTFRKMAFDEARMTSGPSNRCACCGK